MKLRKFKSGFTLTELLVLIAVSGILVTLLLPNLDQARAKLLQQACVANMKQLGMAIDMYSQDNNGTILYFNVSGLSWDDSGSPLWRYLSNGTNAFEIMRSMRLCPARAGSYPPNGGNNPHGYTIPIGNYRKGLGYSVANSAGSPFYDSATGTYWPNLKSVPKPAKYLLLIESKGNTITCGTTALRDAVTQLHSGSGGDVIPAINRHLALINCLFGDFHVEALTTNQLSAMEGFCTSANPPNYTFTLN